METSIYQSNQFENHWKIVADTVLSQIRRQLALGHVDVDVINQTLNAETKKWKYGNLSEHLWWEDLKDANPEKAEAFASKCNCFRLSAVEGIKMPDGKISIFTGLACGICSFAGMYQFTSWEWFKQAVVAVLVAVLVSMSLNIPLAKKKYRNTEYVIKKYSDQLLEMKNELLNILK